MKQCGKCGFYNTDGQERCVKCGAVLDHTDEVPLRVLPAKRRRLRNPLWFVRERIYKFKQSLHFELPKGVDWRYPWVAGWLGIIPGLGQIYNHQYTKAVWFFAGWLVLIGVNVFTLTQWINVPIMIGTILYMLWSFNDGVITATRINGQKWTLRLSLAFFSYLLFTLGVLLLLAQYFFTPIFVLVYVSQDVLAPGLRKGDRMFIDCVSYWFRSPRRGEVVYYDPPRYTIEIPGALQNQVIVINERRGFGRVVALPGDRYERRDGVYYLNGKPVPPELEPLTSRSLWDNFVFETVPEGKYLVIIGHASEEEGIPIVNLLGGRSPELKSGVIVQGWDKACLVTKKEIFGRGICIYFPPPRRQWLIPSKETVQPFIRD